MLYVVQWPWAGKAGRARDGRTASAFPQPRCMLLQARRRRRATGAPEGRQEEEGTWVQTTRPSCVGQVWLPFSHVKRRLSRVSNLLDAYRPNDACPMARRRRVKGFDNKRAKNAKPNFELALSSYCCTEYYAWDKKLTSIDDTLACNIFR